MALYGVGLNTTVNRINLEFRSFLAQNKGGTSVRNLKRIFKQFDADKSGRLDLEEFEKCLASFGFFLKKVDYQALLKFYDRN